VIDDLIALDRGVDRRDIAGGEHGRFTKKPMKPRRMPCFFSNRSL
jgi:hypothetical protein